MCGKKLQELAVTLGLADEIMNSSMFTFGKNCEVAYSIVMFNSIFMMNYFFRMRKKVSSYFSLYSKSVFHYIATFVFKRMTMANNFYVSLFDKVFTLTIFILFLPYKFSYTLLRTEFFSSIPCFNRTILVFNYFCFAAKTFFVKNVHLYILS